MKYVLCVCHKLKELGIYLLSFSISSKSHYLTGNNAYTFWAPKSLQMVTPAMKLKDAYSLEGKL